jgi:RNase P subunit RPR2
MSEKQQAQKYYREREKRRQRRAEHEKRTKERERIRREKKASRALEGKLSAKEINDENKITEKSLQHLFSLAKMYFATNPQLAHFYMFQFHKLAQNYDYDVNSVRTEFCQQCKNVLIPGITSHVKNITSENLSEDPLNTCTSFVNLSKFSSLMSYKCLLCEYKTIYPGVPKSRQKTEEKRVKVLEPPTKRQRIDQIITETKQAKELKQVLSMGSTTNKKKKQIETKEQNVSDFLSSLGIK